MRYFLVFVLVGAAALAAAAAAYWFWLPQMPAGPDPGDQIETGTAVLGFFFATVAAFAGAVASMYVAILGLEVSRGQESLSALTFLEERFRSAADRFAELTMSLGEYYAAALVLNGRVSEVLKASGAAVEDMNALMGQPLPPGLERENDQAERALRRLSAALRAVAVDTFATACLMTAHKRIAAKLPDLANRMESLGYARREAEIRFENLADLRAFMEIAADKLAARGWGPVLIARLQSNVGPAKDHGNASVRVLVFAGNLIFAISTAAPNGQAFLSLPGAAMLHDLVRSLPGTADLLAALAQAYPDLRQHAPRLKNTFEPQLLISKNLKDALDDADKTPDLYFALL